MYIMIGFGVVVWLALTALIAITFRRVVSTNEVHIVQAAGSTKSYGKDTTNGNVYYEWPSWIPVIGISKVILPVSVFNINLTDYEAYDKDRVPFVVDAIAFFRINDSNIAAQRVSHFREMGEQLLTIVKGAVRTVLANADINEIMTQRTVFGEKFTQEVTHNLESWGVIPVKSLELMDIRDSHDSAVIHNIMRKKQSEIEMDSRKTVADNIKNANIAEITAQQLTEVQHQDSLQQIGVRTAEKDKAIGIAQQVSSQEVMEQNRITKEKEMAVTLVSQVRQAEIDKQVNVVRADQQKQVAITTSEGSLAAKKLEAEGVQALGTAQGAAEQARLMAPVNAQIALADKIGSSEGYQNYLITIRRVEAEQAVGIQQAEALKAAQIKVIANGGDVVGGMSKITDIFSSKGGQAINGMLSALANTDEGKALINKVTGGNNDPRSN